MQHFNNAVTLATLLDEVWGFEYYGDSRTDLATCDKSEILATPLMIISEKDFDLCIEKTAEQAYQEMKESGLAKQIYLTTIYNNRRK